SAIYLLSELIQRPDGTYAGAPLLNHEQTGYHPAEQMYQAADGWVAIAARGESAARRLVEVLGLSGTVKEPRAQWGVNESRAIAGAVKTRNVAELTSALEQAGVWAEPCRQNVEHEALNDPQLTAQGTVYRSVHPQFGEVKQVGPLFRFSAAPNSAQGHSALPGEHTRAVLSELGYSAAEIESFYERKIVA
ncbi:MAG: CoA transferase, partial [Steroidobacteraceae bacterium]